MSIAISHPKENLNLTPLKSTVQQLSHFPHDHLQVLNLFLTI